MDSSKLLGDFLRTRREALASVCFSRGPGRAEVAMLAGISTAAYTRLEDGTERRPSERALGRLARVLQLKPPAREQMWALARPLLCPGPEGAAGKPVSPHLRRLIDGWTDTPALLCDRLMNVRAANCLGTALLDGLEHADNLFRLVFLDPAAPDFFQEWYHIAGAATDSLHAVRTGADDPELAALVGELSEQSRDFRRLWAGHDLVTDAHRFKRMRHREIGDVTLLCDVFDVQRLPGHQLIVFQTERDSPSEHALALLGSLAVTTI
ncbi:helix-turn-helix domain-containing protein [Nonomuraea sp. K274]|uniref:Helix-turn-helix domain-containing protein n=1 Tax=Nonomuraea cypriaca TaxID=1187855 RepID=A0A931F389_9ACTN|nr:helix-turn-helix transcriptional regulator [Nonomuraea cypriaca]MBF8191392.1 helix-turn-helix domain-containing protein [Nonomuraea cypriaca]